MKSMINEDKSRITIGQWSFYSEFGRFHHPQGLEFFLDNRLNKLLQILIEKRTTIVKRKEIIDFVWGDIIVNEENLTKGIFDLRKLLKEKAITEIEIETIRNIGYRLRIKDKEKSPTSKSILRLTLQMVFYFILTVAFISILIRAFRYEN